MKFDKNNKIAYIGWDGIHLANYPVGLMFEHLFGEVTAECVVNNLTYKEYINNHLYNNDKQLEEDFDSDFYDGYDFMSSSGMKINSKIYYQKGNSFHVKRSVFNNNYNLVDYFCVIIPDGNNFYNAYNDYYLYLFSYDLCAEHRDDSGNVLLSGMMDKYYKKIKLTPEQRAYYFAGYKQYRNKDIDGLISVFKKETDYDVIVKNLNED